MKYTDCSTSYYVRISALATLTPHPRNPVFVFVGVFTFRTKNYTPPTSRIKIYGVLRTSFLSQPWPPTPRTPAPRVRFCWRVYMIFVRKLTPPPTSRIKIYRVKFFVFCSYLSPRHPHPAPPHPLLFFVGVFVFTTGRRSGDTQKKKQQRWEVDRQVPGAAAAAADGVRDDRVLPHPDGGAKGGRRERGAVFEATEAHIIGRGRRHRGWCTAYITTMVAWLLLFFWVYRSMFVS